MQHYGLCPYFYYAAPANAAVGYAFDRICLFVYVWSSYSMEQLLSPDQPKDHLYDSCKSDESLQRAAKLTLYKLRQNRPSVRPSHSGIV